MNYELVGLGNALLDFQLEVPEEVLSELDIKKGSMTLVDPQFQLKQLTNLHTRYKRDDFNVSSGGSAANTVAAFASFGGKALFVGKVGSDENGKLYEADMKKEGVDFQSKPSSELPTGTCLALITPDAERTMLTSLGTSVNLSNDDLDEDSIAQSQITYLEGYLWDSPSARASLERASEIAKSNSKKIAFTYSDAFCVDRHKADFISFTKNHVDILFANESEALSATGEKSVENALKTISSWAETVCISTGAKGALISTQHGKQTEQVRTWDVKVIDKLGAGDGFAAGVLFGLARNKSLKECAYLGCYAATRVIQQMSARVQTPLKKEIELAIQGPGENAVA